MPSFGEQLADRYTQHAIDLERFQATLRNKALAVLLELEKNLLYQLITLDPTSGNQQARLNKLLITTRESIITAYKDIKSYLRQQLSAYSQVESDFVMASMNQIAGVELMSVSVSANQLKALAGDIMIKGAPSAEWWARASTQVMNKFADVVRHGLLVGDTNQAIAKSMREQVFPLASKDAMALIRSSFQAVNSSARLATFEANNDVVKAIQQRSTLDMKTTEICIAYSGRAWTNDELHTPIGHDLPFINEGGSSFGIPRHWCCRSNFLPITRSWAELGADGLKTGGRTAKDTEGYFVKRLQEKGLTDEEIAKVVRGAQASMDGQVPKDWDYETWLKSKSTAFQKSVLGEKKWELWQAGKITFRDLVDETGRPLTLEDLLNKIKS